MTPTRPVIRALGLASVAVMLTGIVAVVADGDAPLPPASARATVEGRATVVHLDGSTDRLSSGDVVRAGEEVRVEVGSVELELADGGTLEGRDGIDQTPATRVVVDALPELVAGELLVLGDPGLAVDAAGTIVSVTEDGSAAKLQRGLAVTAGTYEGALEVDSAGQRRAVPALRQLGIATFGRPPASPEPLDVERDDEWDRRFLGGAIDLGLRLDRFSQFFTAEAPAGAARSATLFRTLLPDLADEPALDDLLRDGPTRSAGEVLVGAAMVSLGRQDSFADRWQAVFEFREDGAEWGLVALDQGVSDRAVLAVVDAIVEVIGETPDIAVPTTTPTTSGTTPTSSASPTSPPTSTPPGSPPTAPPTSPPPTLPPPPTDPTVPTLPPTPPPDDGSPDTGIPIVDDVVEPIDDILDGLLG